MRIFASGVGARSGFDGHRGAWLRLGSAAGATIVTLMSTLLYTASPAHAANPPTHPAPPSGRVIFGIEPASPGGPDGRPNFSYSATPGAIVLDRVAALNYSASPLPLQIYSTDAVETANGGFGLLPATDKPTGVGSWISGLPGTNQITVPADNGKTPGQVVVPFSVHIPARVTPGDHVGGIIVSLQTVGANSSGQKIVLDQRIGSRIYIRVAGKLVPSLTLVNEHATYSGTLNPVGEGEVRVSYVVKNTGNVDLGVSRQTVSVSGWVGPDARVALPRVTLLLPGASVAESAVAFGLWPEVFLHAHVNVQPVAITTTGAGGQALAPVSSGSTVWAVPWSFLVLLVLVILAVVLLVRARRRAKSRRAKSRHAKSRHAKRQRSVGTGQAEPQRPKVTSAP